MTSEAANFPRIEALTHEDGTGALIVQGRRHEVTTPDVHQTRAQLMQLAADQARALGRPVKVTTGGVEPTYHLIVDEHGQVSEDTNPPAPTTTRGAARAAAAQDAITNAPASVDPPPAVDLPPRPPLPAVAPTPAPEAIGAAAWTTEAPAARRDVRTSFLTQEEAEKPATQGIRGALTRAGIRMAPSDAERAARADERAVSQHWPGPRTIAVVNGKGGAGKTPTTILLSATFALHGGPASSHGTTTRRAARSAGAPSRGRTTALCSTSCRRPNSCSARAHRQPTSRTSFTTRPATASTCCAPSRSRSRTNSASPRPTSTRSTPSPPSTTGSSSSTAETMRATRCGCA